MQKQGLWMDDEDARLLSAVRDLGQSWEKVSLRVCRTASDCKDRYRNHLAKKENRISGKWAPEEEHKLTNIIAQISAQQGPDTRNITLWGQVSEQMSFTRSPQQCRDKWNESLRKTLNNGGHTTYWTTQDAYILVHKVDALNVQDDTEINWNTLVDPAWNWTGRDLRRRWKALKSKAEDSGNKTHAEIMDILRAAYPVTIVPLLFK